jgi:type III secretion protein U
LANQPSEERTLPATARKLREARKKGQVAKSADFIHGVLFLATALYMLVMWPTITERMSDFFAYTSENYTRPFPEMVRQSSSLFFSILLPITLTLGIVTLIAGLFGGMFSTFGTVFSFEPLKPNFDRINPVAGFGRLFSLRVLTEILKGIVKIAILTAAFWFLLRGDFQSMYNVPACGEACPGPVLYEMIYPLVILAMIAYFLIGLADLLIQRALFLREMRMTHSELKQERKNQEGDPQIKRQMKRLRRRAATEPPVRLGLKNATIVLAGGGNVIGVRYVEAKTPIPIIVSVASGGDTASLLEAAETMRIPIFRDAVLAGGLAEKQKPGERLKSQFFGSVANYLVQSGV